MVRQGMKRYRTRTAAQAELVGDDGEQPLDLDACFGRRAPRRLEIGFGHGRFLSQMAASHPAVDFIGVEHKELRVTKTAHKSLGLDATNVRLFHDDAQHFVHHRLPPASLERVYMLFPDPWPKRRHRRRRTGNRAFLVDLAHALGAGGRFIFASDTHNYTFQMLTNSSTMPGVWRNCYGPSGYRMDIPTRFPTVFEVHKKSEGHRIAYLMLERTDAPAPPKLAIPCKFSTL